jgi:hypothetical protein
VEQTLRWFALGGDIAGSVLGECCESAIGVLSGCYRGAIGGL